MVSIACLISNGYEILLIQQLSSSEKQGYALPECSAESIESAQRIITERLRNEEILFDFDEILYETKAANTYQILYLCHAFHWTCQVGNASCKWVELRKLKRSLISSSYKELLNEVNNYLTKREKILSQIKTEITNLHNQNHVKIVIGCICCLVILFGFLRMITTTQMWIARKN